LFRSDPVTSAYVSVRSSLPQNGVVSHIRVAVRSRDPNLAIADIHAMGDLVTQTTARRRFQTTLLIVFSGVPMFLAAVGMYGAFLACPIPGYRASAVDPMAALRHE
jgi:ABC-type lipoprotein release transport system permease subunit